MSPWWPWHGRSASSQQRWVVLDVESSGLDPYHDRLLAIAALGVHWHSGRPMVCVGDSFEVLLRQDELPALPDRSNILIHGIGMAAQRSGRARGDALRAFVDFVAEAPLVAFHASFDRALISRALRLVPGLRLPSPWLDLADLAPALLPDVAGHALDEWLDHFGIEVAERHQAASDTWATAELLQRLWPLAARQGCRPGFKALERLATSRRWLARS